MRNAIYVLLITLAISTTTYLGFELGRAGTTSFCMLVGLPAVALAALAMVRAHRDGELRNLLRPAWGDATRAVMGALAMFALAYAFARMTAGGPRESWLARLYLQLGSPTVLRDHMPQVAVGIVLVAAAEELMWRGLVTTLLAEKVGSRTAWIYAAVLYAIVYVPTAWALRDPEAGLNPVLPLAALAGGLIWGGLGRYFGRLLPGILAHALFDWVVVMTFRLWGMSI